MRLDNLPSAPGRTANDYGAVIFDMDGVVTDTAAVHAAAWKSLFDQVLPKLGGPSQPPFDTDLDYRKWVDGRSRADGVRAFLASRALTLPEGEITDDAEQLTVAGLTARKQQLFTDALARVGVRVFPDARKLLEQLRAVRVPTALVTASRNSAAILDAAGITELFTVRVDGTDALRMKLPGKPDPAMFVAAAHRLRIEPIDAVVMEDAAAGVRAAAAGGFGLVVGVDHTGTGTQLTDAGADVIVTDLADLHLIPGDGATAIEYPSARWCAGATIAGPGGWNLVYDGFDPAREGTREALCALGNGYWGTRAATPGSTADSVHYPGTYLAGIYNRHSSELHSGTVESEHLVNAPDWTFLTIRPVDGPTLRPGTPEMLGHHQDLNLRAGVLTRVDRYRDDAGRTTRVITRQFQSLSDPRLAALQFTIEAEDWTGAVVITSTINGRVANRNVAADRALAHAHLAPLGYRELDSDTVLYEAITDQSDITIALAARTHTDAEVSARELLADTSCPGHEFTVAVRPGNPVTIEKVAVVATSRDRGLSTAALDVEYRIARAPAFADLLAAHVDAWARLWDRFGIRLEDGRNRRLALNLHIFHMLQATVAVGPDADVGLPARGLHGEGYRGHIFWDELFVYPVLTLRRPELTRAFLRYRHRRLPRARAAASAEGLAGALFPWQSGSDGREETPDRLFNIRDGQWMSDNSHRQRHVGLALAYSVWQYFQATADLGFLIDCGAEILVEVARLFANLAVHDPVEDRFDITGVMGPDEYHDGYPDAPGRGVRNNAYTNVLTAWVLMRAHDAVALLTGTDCDPLWDRLRLTPQEPALWDRISARLRIPFHDGIISQFEGYEKLAEFDWDAYRSKYGEIGRLDLILQAEGDTTNRFKLSKQADVLMLFYLFSAEELRTLFDRLGYELPPELIPRTVEYYLARTSHGSTLSRLAHAWVLARTDRARSWSLFTEALDTDLADTQGGTTREGVHIGAMAGTADMVIRCYGGVETRHDVLRLHPVLPAELSRTEFTLSYRGQPLSITLTRTRAVVRLLPSTAAPIRVCIEDIEKTLSAGEIWEVPLNSVEPHIDSAGPALGAKPSVSGPEMPMT
ncbi:beta-phosphoglucomutase family hydrolase [Nocardia sp. CA-107356]|uniref:beta-phosphoglucomutase family hydrolase n=1 Tax=Nocardia sp. CA-107356 TaxID=3239972 RepID=UPI003D8FE771